MRTRNLLCLVLACSLALGVMGCGGGDGDSTGTGSVRIGASVYGLPFLPTAGGASQSVTVGLKNASSIPATVYLTAFTPGGATYPAGADLPFTVPGRGELRVPLSLITGGVPVGGWVYIDTRDVTTLDAITGEPTPTATSGYVETYLHRGLVGTGGEQDDISGFTGRATGVQVAVMPATDSVQIVNYSFNQVAGGPVMPLPISYTVSSFDAFGALLVSTPVVVPANGSAALPFTTGAAVWSVRVEPTAGALPPPPPLPAVQTIRYGVIARENGLQNHQEARYQDEPPVHWTGQMDLGFEVDFGPDSAGNVHDFALLMSNPTTTDASIVLRAVYSADGQPLLTQPRGYVLGAGRTVYMRTTTRDSLGLDTAGGEVSFFDDLFGDVFLATGFEEVTLHVQVPSSIDLSARHFDPAFASFWQVLKQFPLSNNVNVADLPIQVTQGTGLRNLVSITNPTTGPLRVPVRGFTPGGTEYILDDLEVPAYTRMDWTPDGMNFREDPSDTTGPIVPYMQFLFTPSGGAFFRGRTVARDANGLIFFITPMMIRDN